MHHAHIDKFSFKDSPIHRLDCRVKFIAALVFTAVVISLPPTSLAILTCYAVGPFTILVLAQIPLRFAFKQVLLTSPFILILAFSCPFYDRQPLAVSFGPFLWHLTVGWIRCFTILGKFTVTMLALIALISTTRFGDLLAGLQNLGVPKLLTVQLGFLYRYIFVVIDTAQHILSSRQARTLRNLGFKTEFKTAAAMLGSLFIRSLDSAEKINIAMQARGFDANFSSISRLKICFADIIFALTATTFILTLYFLIKPLLMVKTL